MVPKNFLTLPFVVLGLIGCIATKEGYQEKIGIWQGVSERDLIKSWGPPSSVYNSSGFKFLTYSKKRTVVVPADPFYEDRRYRHPEFSRYPNYSRRDIFYERRSSYTVEKICETTFTLEKQRVVSMRFEGNDCLAVPAKDK